MFAFDLSCGELSNNIVNHVVNHYPKSSSHVPAEAQIIRQSRDDTFCDGIPEGYAEPRRVAHKFKVGNTLGRVLHWSRWPLRIDGYIDTLRPSPQLTAPTRMYVEDGSFQRGFCLMPATPDT